MSIQTIKYKKYTRKNMQNEYTGTTKCSTNTNPCNKCNLKNRQYKAFVRVPMKGYRKTLQCKTKDNTSITNDNCYSYQEVFRDTYTNNNNVCPTNTTSGNYSRTQKPLIRSGMMPNKYGTAKIDTENNKHKNRYAYSYRERMNNLKKTTYNRNLPSNIDGKLCFNGDAGCSSQVVQNLNNKNYFQQGAVSSSSRLERLKLNTLMKNTKCPNTNNNCSKKCCYDKSLFVNRIVGPKDIYNGTHKECQNNPNVYSNALFKVRGVVSSKGC